MKNENGVTRNLEKAVFPYRWRWNGVFWGLANEKLVQNGAEWRTGKNEKTGRKTAGFCVLERLRQRAQNCLATALQNGSFGVAIVQNINKEKRRCIANLHALQCRFSYLCKNTARKKISSEKTTLLVHIFSELSVQTCTLEFLLHTYDTT